MTHGELRDVAYRVPWRSSSVRNGVHRSRMIGGGGVFKDLVPLMRHPDPRRIALRASVSDPFENLLVQRSEQTTAISVYVLVDVSASMAFQGRANKLALAADMAEALSICAARAGDQFGLIAFDQTARDELLLPRTRSRAAHRAAIDQLRAFTPHQRGVDGIAQAAGLLSGAKKLVFLISDFLWSNEDAEQAFANLSLHDVVPIEIDDSMQIDGLPEWGLLRLFDLETNTRRLVAMRPALKQAWKLRRQERRAAISARCAQSGREPFTVQDQIGWDRLISYLMHGHA